MEQCADIIIIIYITYFQTFNTMAQYQSIEMRNNNKNVASKLKMVLLFCRVRNFKFNLNASMLKFAIIKLLKYMFC